MALLIDGYNLLHATGIVGQGHGPGGLQRAREGLLGFLAASIDQVERKRTTIVFDATDAPPGLPRTMTHEEMTVRYASEYPDADSLIEELIQQHDAPRSLLVVSSDHRIQRAARRRRSGSIDSDRWYAELCQQRSQKCDQQRKPTPGKPAGNLSPAEIDYWIQEFSEGKTIGRADSPSSQDASSASPDRTEEPENPFPPGYGEDLLREEEDTDV